MLDVSERRVCRVLGQHRSTQRKVPCGADDEEALTDDILALAKQYGRYGYRRVTALLHAAGWSVNHKRVERIWRREGLKSCPLLSGPSTMKVWIKEGRATSGSRVSRHNIRLPLCRSSDPAKADALHAEECIAQSVNREKYRRRIDNIVITWNWLKQRIGAD